MPLTSFSISQPGEFDVEQTLTRVSAQFGQTHTFADDIPENLRNYLRADLQCPSCFATGAEIVWMGKKNGGSARQSFFRFTTPGHKPFCDFDSQAANFVPENLVSFMQSRSNLTRAIRQLICTGIEQGVFNQVSIRDMREWFFNKKVESHFVVTLNPRLIPWLETLQKNVFMSSGALPTGAFLTSEIAALAQFNWTAEAARRVMERYPEHEANMKAIRNQSITIFGDAGKRAQSLAQRFAGRLVFDPTVLANEYKKTKSLAAFISHNYLPLKSVSEASATASVLAFSALLLFVQGWNVSQAASTFARIAAAVGGANQGLGNVMGLNPFHDYSAWKIVKRLQDLNISVPDNIDIKSERTAVEAALREQFGAEPMPS